MNYPPPQRVVFPLQARHGSVLCSHRYRRSCMSSSQTQRCADSAADNTRNLNQSSFASSSLSYFTTFHLIWGEGNRYLNLFCSLSLSSITFFVKQLNFFKKRLTVKHVLGLCLTGPWGSPKPELSRRQCKNRHRIQQRIPTYCTHRQMHECGKSKPLPQNFPSKNYSFVHMEWKGLANVPL